MKTLYKSNTNFVLSGVLGGLGEYYNVDPTILRLGYVVFTIMTGVFPAIIGYIIAAIIVPTKNPSVHMNHTEKHEEKTEEKPKQD